MDSSLLHRGMSCACLVLFLLSSRLFGTPSNDALECAYRMLFSRELGYTLLGEKPISEDSLSYYFKVFPEAQKTFITSIKNTFKGSSNLVLKVFPFGKGYVLELINKKAVRRIVSKHVFVQKFIKNRFVCVTDFYEKLEDPNISIFHIINDEWIAGYFLGYCRANSHYFVRRFVLGKHLKKPPIVSMFPVSDAIYPSSLYPHLSNHTRFLYRITRPKQGKGFASLEDEWQWIKKVSWDIEEENQPVPPYYLSLPMYVCRHGGDSELIREHYKKARAKLAHFFCKNSILQAITEEASKKYLAFGNV